jgi:hypothetical protein
MLIRKTMVVTEKTQTDETGTDCAPLVRVAAIAVLRNPFAGTDQEDLADLIGYGAGLGAQLADEALSVLGAPAVSYGKAALVGVHGAAEHGAAILHPRFGKPVRAAIGGGQALMPSVVKVGVLGATIDLPLGHKDDPWSFVHIDTISIAVADAPRPDEIVICLGLADGARIRPRVGSGPA